MDPAFEISQELLHICNAMIKKTLRIRKYKHKTGREREREMFNGIKAAEV